MDVQLLSGLLLKLESYPALKAKIKSLYNETAENSARVEEVYNSLISLVDSIPLPVAKVRPVRVYMAACMDIIHSGHFNCMRQAKKLGDILVIGVISDEEIRRCKGPPVMNQEERRIMAEACKWADEVVDGVEYYVTPDILERVGCDYVVHGDDLAIRKDTGTDAYADVRAAGKLKIIKRTEGISTTDMVGKMLLMTSNELVTSPPTQISASTKTQFLSTTRRINQFSTPKTPAPTDRIVYIDGAFDLLHRGHVETIKRAREFGDYLIVGVHDDRTVNSIKGLNYPIMNLHERTLNLLALKYVDDVIMGAPWEITEDMIKTLNIQVVVQGTNHKDSMVSTPHEDPYTVPKRLGIYQEIDSVCNINAEDIVDRIVAHRLQYTKRNERMTASQQQYYENKQFVPEI